MKTKVLYAIVLLIGLMFIVRECNGPQPCDDVKHDTITKVEIKVKEVPVYVHVIKPVVDTVIDSFPVNQPIDTNAILADYYLFRKYQIYLKSIDTAANLTMHANVWRNELQDAYVTGEVYRKTVFKTEIIEKSVSRRKLFVGAQLAYGIPGLDSTKFIGLSGGLMYQSKKDHAYSLTYDPFNHIGYYTMWFKLNLRRNSHN